MEIPDVFVSADVSTKIIYNTFEPNKYPCLNADRAEIEASDERPILIGGRPAFLGNYQMQGRVNSMEMRDELRVRLPSYFRSFNTLNSTSTFNADISARSHIRSCCGRDPLLRQLKGMYEFAQSKTGIAPTKGACKADYLNWLEKHWKEIEKYKSDLHRIGHELR